MCIKQKYLKEKQSTNKNKKENNLYLIEQVEESTY